MDVNTSHRKRVRDGVKESEGVLGTHIHHSPVGRKLIVELNFDWRKQATKFFIHPFDAFDEEAIQPFPRLIYRSCRQQLGKRLKLVFKLALLGLLEGFTRLDIHGEDVHDLAR